jgi:hypothetical protein
MKTCPIRRPERKGSALDVGELVCQRVDAVDLIRIEVQEQVRAMRGDRV